MFTYEPLTQEQCEKENSFPLMEPGTYNFQVLESKYKLSKTGNNMIELILTVWDNNGKEFHIYDYLVATPKMMWKTLHFCKAVGLEQEYLGKKFNEDLCINRSGKVDIIYQAGQSNPNGGKYPDKNGVEDYVLLETAIPGVAVLKKDNFFDDSIPF